MKAHELFEKLTELKKKHENLWEELDIVVDNDENGWYSLEDVFVFKDDLGVKYINLESSNTI